MLFGDGPKGNKFANAGVGENDIDSPFQLSSELVNFHRSLSITCVRAPLGQGDRRDGSCGSVGWRSDCAKHLWRNLPPIRPSAYGPNRTKTLFQTPSALQH